MLDFLTYLGLFLYTALASGVVGLMGTPCCCVTYCGGGCTTDPNGHTAQVTITGVANAACPECTNINGTYMIPLVFSCVADEAANSFSRGVGCGEAPAGPNGTWRLGLSISTSGANTIVTFGVLITTVDGIVSHQYTYDAGASPVACPPTGVLPMTGPTGTHPACDLTGSVVTVEFI